MIEKLILVEKKPTPQLSVQSVILEGPTGRQFIRLSSREK